MPKGGLMKIKNGLQILKILFLNVALLACSFVTRVVLPATVTPSPTVTSTHTPQATATIEVTSTPFYSVKAGAPIRAQSGGFSFSEIEGYEIQSSHPLGAYLKSPDKNIEAMLIAYPRSDGVTISELLSDWRKGFAERFNEVVFSDPVKETSNPMELIYDDFSGTKNEVPYEGRLAIYEPPDSKLIYVYVIAYGDQRWQREGNKVFHTLANSIKTFKITALPDCPIKKNRMYGYEKTSPIKIGGGNDDGIGRIHDYLGVLLGLKGEIVLYTQILPVIHDAIELQVYQIRIGSTYSTLYFDINNYEELSAPYNLTCSAPMPGRPSGIQF
jgi:hypothetical protein